MTNLGVNIVHADCLLRGLRYGLTRAYRTVGTETDAENVSDHVMIQPPAIWSIFVIAIGDDYRFAVFGLVTKL